MVIEHHMVQHGPGILLYCKRKELITFILGDSLCHIALLLSSYLIKISHVAILHDKADWKV